LQFRKELDEGQQCKYIKIQILYKNYSKSFKFNKNFVILLVFMGKEIKIMKKNALALCKSVLNCFV
tara:strand:+ start:563 stop:760 length:198 start_codon:yes stop_codon:yes gene_type:complete